MNENSIDDILRDSRIIEHKLLDILDSQEGKIIKSDIEVLKSMGFDEKMINKVYILLRPPNIERAIDYMTEIDGIYQHDFFMSSKNDELCFICKKPKKNHLDYIPENLMNDNFNINNQNINDEEQILESNNNTKKDKNDKNDDIISEECEVCYEEINEEDKKLNSIPCGHLFCSNCWFNYLKSLILEAKVEKIKCMDHECNEIISEDFIFKHLSSNKDLIDKYNKFKMRAEIIKDKNKKLCPAPDCDSFLQKSKKTKYVKCENGHEYCFDCLKKPHGKRQCEKNVENQFEKWTKKKRAKRCPKCQIYTEKNEGCNHMTCVSCKYQWCWLCEGEYKYNHYKSGTCKGLQFVKGNNYKQFLFLNKMWGLHKIFTCVFPKINGPPFIDEYMWAKYLVMFLSLLFGFPFIYGYVLFNYAEQNIKLDNNFQRAFTFFAIFIGVCLWICFQISFSCLIAPFILVSFIYHPFFYYIMIFFGIGELD